MKTGQPHAQTWAMVIGTRPEAIKMAPILHELRAHDHLRPLLISTGQHQRLLDQAFADFALKPDYRLEVMRENQSLSELTARILQTITPIFVQEKPAAVLVQGDTTTAFSAALAAFYMRIPVYHIEAGLRSHQLHSPFPEEANRSLITRLAKLHFAPTQQACTNLLSEGVAPAAIHLTGNSIVDALHWIQARLPQQFPGDPALLGTAATVLETGQPYVLVTAHRREIFGEGIAQLCAALRRIAAAFPQLHLLFPVHLNPHILVPVRTQLGDCANIHLLPPLHYAPFVWLMQRCHFIITDSGGIQEEAATLGKPLIVTRAVTERIEGLAQQSAMLTGTSDIAIFNAAKRLMEDAAFYDRMAAASSCYGDGKTSARIVQAILADLAPAPAQEVAV